METPTGKAILLCEQVIEDRYSGNKTIVGTFNRIHAPRFPLDYPRMAVFVALVNGRGPVTVKLVLKNEESTLLETSGPIEFDNPHQVVEIIFSLVGIRFDSPGLYVIEVFAEDIFIFQTTFEVAQITSPPTR